MAKQYEIKATTFDKRGRKIAVGYNRYDKTHTRQAHYAEQAGLSDKVYLHAEVAALIRSRRRKVHRIVIERYDSENRPVLARPCPICMLALEAARVKVIEYTVEPPADFAKILDNSRSICYHSQTNTITEKM